MGREEWKAKEERMKKESLCGTVQPSTWSRAGVLKAKASGVKSLSTC